MGATSFTKRDQEGFVFRICERGKEPLAFVKEQLDAGMPPNARERELTALTGALLHKRWAIAHLLLDRGADPHALYKGRATLHLAVYGETHIPGVSNRIKPDLCLVRRLLDLGVDVNAQDKKGTTPLGLVESLEAAELLLDSGADPTIAPGTKSVPSILWGAEPWLHYEPRRAEMVLLLLSRGAPWPTKWSLFEKLVNHLKKKAGLKRLVAEYGLPLDSKLGRRLPGADKLLAKTAKASTTKTRKAKTTRTTKTKTRTKETGSKSEPAATFSKKEQGDFAYLAFQGGKRRLERMRALLEAGMPVDARHRKTTALLVALECDQWAMAHLLLDHGADAGERSNGASALYHAAQGPDLALVARLLDFGLDVDERESRNGLSPLAVAASKEVAALLLDRGADPNLEVGRGTKTRPLILGHKRSLQLYLLSRGAAWPESRHLGTLITTLSPLGKAYKLVTEHGLPADRLWGTLRPIDWAVAHNESRLVRWLLEHQNVDLNAKVRLPPLHAAVLGGHASLVRILLQAGADPSLRVGRGVNVHGSAVELAQWLAGDDAGAVRRRGGKGKKHRDNAARIATLVEQAR